MYMSQYMFQQDMANIRASCLRSCLSSITGLGCPEIRNSV